MVRARTVEDSPRPTSNSMRVVVRPHGSARALIGPRTACLDHPPMALRQQEITFGTVRNGRVSCSQSKAIGELARYSHPATCPALELGYFSTRLRRALRRKSATSIKWMTKCATKQISDRAITEEGKHTCIPTTCVMCAWKFPGIWELGTRSSYNRAARNEKPRTTGVRGKERA